MASSSATYAPGTVALSQTGSQTLRLRLVWLSLVALTFTFIASMSFLAIAQHATYTTGRQDLEIYTQVIWNTANGHPFETTLLKTNRSHLAEHLAGAVILLAPLYRLIPQPELLIVIQQVLLGAAAIPIFLFARWRTGRSVIALALTAAFLLSSAVTRIALDDFHPIVLTVLPLGLSLYWLAVGAPRRAFGMAVFSMFLEEEAALIVIGAGFWLLTQRNLRAGLVWVVSGVIWLALAVFVIMPRFHVAATLPEIAPNRTVGHFGELLTRPSVLTDRLHGERGQEALTRFVLPTGGLALLSPTTLLIDVPSFAALFLQDRDDTFGRHWAAPMLPVLWMATAATIARFRRPQIQAAATVLVLLTTAVGYRLDSPLPGGMKYDAQQFARSERSQVLDDLVARVPPDARVAASANVVAHLANRAGVYVFPPTDHYAAALERQARRPNAYVLDLFDSGTQRIAALDRLSPLMNEPVYSVWSPGHKALLLLDSVPPAHNGTGLIFDEKILLRGYDVRETDDEIELGIQWQRLDDLRGRYGRQITILDADGATVKREDDMPLSTVFGVNKWQNNQVIVDTFRIQKPTSGVAGWTARIAWITRDKQGPILISDGTRAFEIPLAPR